MQIIAYDRRKTSAKFYGNDQFNPTMVYLSDVYTNIRDHFLELEERYVYRGRFSIEYISTYKGLTINLKDIDVVSPHTIHIAESTVKQILEGLLAGDVLIEDNAYVINFLVDKRGNKYVMNVLKRSELDAILENHHL